MKYRCFYLCLMLLAACQSAPPSREQAATPPVADAAPERHFETGTLYNLLAGEMALHRDLYRLALGNYMQEAASTRDPAVAERAAEIAAALHAQPATLQAAQLWTELEPGNARAHFLLALGLIPQNRLAEALEHMLASYRLGGETRFTALAAQAGSADLQQRLYGLLQPMLRHDPGNPDLQLANALSGLATGQFEPALKSVRSVLERSPDDLRSVALESRILLAMGRREEALVRFTTLLARDPDNFRLHLEYARTLAQVNPAEAQSELADLAQKHPDHTELLLALALLAQERQDMATATASFRKLLAQGHYRNEAHFYLGMAAASQGDNASALDHFKAVTPGNAFLESRRQLLKLLLAGNRLTEALQQLRTDRSSLPDEGPYEPLQRELFLMEAGALLDKGKAQESRQVLEHILKRYGKEDLRVLYMHSMACEQLDDLACTERDLRSVLLQDPDNASMLNALGYSLANHSTRYAEALELVERAHKLQPDDAAITDSLGWVHFRLGNLHRAIGYLKQAYERLPESEIGAHLGEALWANGDHKQALLVWTAAWRTQPDSATLRETVERLTGQPLESLGDAGR